MPSVITSARGATSSVFDVVTITADTAVQLIRTASRGVNMLDAKTEILHDRIITNTKLQRVVMIDEEIIHAANQHADLMEDAHRRNYPTRDFDREAFYLAALTKMQEALAPS